MRAGRAIREAARDRLLVVGCVPRDRGDVIREAIEQCGDNPSNAWAKAQLKQMLSELPSRLALDEPRGDAA